jgi:hypothetical protein
MTNTPINQTRRLTEPQWFSKAACHVRWRAAWLAELATLERRTAQAQDVQTVQRIIDRTEAIKRRTKQLGLVMSRHMERAPAELLPAVRHSINVTLQ